MNNTMINTVRGEVTFKQGDLEFTARPTFNLVAELEASTGQSILGLFAKAKDMKLSFTETVQIVAVAARNSTTPPKLTNPALQEAIFQAGPTNWYIPVIELLTNTFITGRPETAEKNAALGKTKK